MKVCIRPRVQCLENKLHKLCGKDQGKGCYFFVAGTVAEMRQWLKSIDHIKDLDKKEAV